MSAVPIFPPKHLLSDENERIDDSSEHAEENETRSEDQKGTQLRLPAPRDHGNSTTVEEGALGAFKMNQLGPMIVRRSKRRYF